MVSLMKVEVLLIMKFSVICQGDTYLFYTFTSKEKTFTNETFAFSLFFSFFLPNLRKLIRAKYFLLEHLTCESNQ